jgi:hypothetical protein
MKRWMAEPDVTLTDYALAVEAALCAYFLARKDRRFPHRDDVGRWLVLFYGSSAGAALAGGTAHGFFPDRSSLGQRILWPATLLSLGVTAFAEWRIAARLLERRALQSWVDRLAAGALLAYSAGVLMGGRRFALAVANYLPATAFLFAALANRYRRTREAPLLPGLASILLAFIGAGVQQRRIPLHPRYADHNAFYHLIQMISLLLFFHTARHLVASDV